MMESSDKQQMNLSADGTREKRKQQCPYSNELLTSSAHTERFWNHCGYSLKNINLGFSGNSKGKSKKPE